MIKIYAHPNHAHTYKVEDNPFGTKTVICENLDATSGSLTMDQTSWESFEARLERHGWTDVHDQAGR